MERVVVVMVSAVLVEQVMAGMGMVEQERVAAMRCAERQELSA